MGDILDIDHRRTYILLFWSVEPLLNLSQNEKKTKQINELGHEKMCLMPYANNKGADQPVHPRSLISTFVVCCQDRMVLLVCRSCRVAERLALPTSDHGVEGSNPAGGDIFPEPKRRFIAQSHSCSPFHRLEMTEILLKGRKTLTHPSILLVCISEISRL